MHEAAADRCSASIRSGQFPPTVWSSVGGTVPASVQRCAKLTTLRFGRVHSDLCSIRTA
jgi:hypothetical protein